MYVKTSTMKSGIIVFVSFTRLVCTAIWVGAIAYSTYQVYLSTEEYLPWQKDPVMNNGPFTKLVKRGRESTDHEWIWFTQVFFFRLFLWLMTYVNLTIFLPSKVLTGVSTIMSFFLLTSLSNYSATFYIFCQPLFYWVILLTAKTKMLVWLLTFGLLGFLNSMYLKEILFGHGHDYYFAIAAGWTYARCISFTFDRWNRTDNTSLASLYSIMSYCFYFPIMLFGPLILYNRYETDVILERRQQSQNRLNYSRLIKNAIKVFGVILLNELIIHYLYFRPLTSTSPLLRQELNLWTLCGIIYWLGQFFMLKYYVFYGCSTCIAEFDGVEMPPLPKCIAHIHRYSVMWKDFDRGLYNFLVEYTYLPILNTLSPNGKPGSLRREIAKLIASVFTFVYVFVWHGVTMSVFVWAAFNFLGINIERWGSLLKRIKPIDKRLHDCPEMFWDFIVEPIVTIPLATMSILNSVVFCGSLEAAIIITERLLWTDLRYNHAFWFLYCFTHVGVMVRTWPKFSSQLEAGFMDIFQR